MDDLLKKIRTCYVNDDGEKWTQTEELLSEHCETLAAEVTRLTQELDEARADMAWIHNAAEWLQNNLSHPRAWQCAQDIVDRLAPTPDAEED